MCLRVFNTSNRTVSEGGFVSASLYGSDKVEGWEVRG